MKLGPFELNRVHCLDCVEAMRQLPEGCIDAVVTDPPYALTSCHTGGAEIPGKFGQRTEEQKIARRRATAGFMGKKWDVPDVAFSADTWAAALRVAKPGAHLLAFGGPRTFHRLTCAIEDAGWEIRDCIMWVYGSGFPKSLDVSKAIDKAAGAVRKVVGEGRGGAALKIGGENPRPWHKRQADRGGTYDLTTAATDAARQWSGWGTALKPAWEPIIVARKPLEGTVAANVIKHGTGALNIDGCRIAAGGETIEQSGEKVDMARGACAAGYDRPNATMFRTGKPKERSGPAQPLGRFPANLIHDGSDEVVACFPEVSSGKPAGVKTGGQLNCYGHFAGGIPVTGFGDSGSAARFFYCAKADKSDRGPGNDHPTVKPLDLMRYLCRLVTPPGGIVLDPFSGSGRTGVAALQLGFRSLGFDLDPHHVGDICAPALEAAAKGITPQEYKEGQEVLFG